MPKGKYDLDVSLSHGTERQNKRRGLKIQQKKLRKEGESQSKKIKRIGYAEKAAKAAIAVDTIAGVVTGTALARQAAKAVAKKAATLIINKGSKFGARTSKSQATDIVKKTAAQVREANRKKAAKGGGAGKKMDKTRTPEAKGRDPIVPRSATSSESRKAVAKNKYREPDAPRVDARDHPHNTERFTPKELATYSEKELAKRPRPKVKGKPQVKEIPKSDRNRPGKRYTDPKTLPHRSVSKTNPDYKLTRDALTKKADDAAEGVRKKLKPSPKKKKGPKKNASSANVAADRRKLGIKNKSADFEDPTTKGGKNRTNRKK
jgi:hypothetical protein